MQINPYLSFNGKCEAAFKFYEKALNGKMIMMMRYGESPAAAQTSPDSRDKIIHARLAIGDALLMGSDAPPQIYEPMQGVSVSLSSRSPAKPTAFSPRLPKTERCGCRSRRLSGRCVSAC
jgi:PhnB protein